MVGTECFPKVPVLRLGFHSGAPGEQWKFLGVRSSEEPLELLSAGSGRSVKTAAPAPPSFHSWPWSELLISTSSTTECLNTTSPKQRVLPKWDLWNGKPKQTFALYKWIRLCISLEQRKPNPRASPRKKQTINQDLLQGSKPLSRASCLWTKQ